MNNVCPFIHRYDPAAALYTGKNIGAAVLDTGIFPHMDFTMPQSRIAAFCDFTKGRRAPYDDNGHGTHICGIIGGNGRASHRKYCGIAPDCRLIVGKILDKNGNGNISLMIDAIQWVISTKEIYGTRILNISLGTIKDDTISESSPLIQSVNMAWDSGIVVIAAAGNNGPKPMSITAPGISRKIITVGAWDDHNYIYVRGKKISGYSGRGPTREGIAKPDLCAPGSHIMSCSNQMVGSRCTYTGRSGTSMSTPIVSGCVALLLEKYPNLSPDEVKNRLVQSCDDLHLSKYHQGAGAINAAKLLR